MNNPGESWLPIAPAFREAVATAQRRLYVVNPYLADRRILRGLVEAGLRGVDVRVIVPADPRSPLASGAVRHWFGPMIDAGIDVREHQQMAHAKVVLADDVVLMGTANLDALSLRQNWELQLRVTRRRVRGPRRRASCSTATSRSRCRASSPPAGGCAPGMRSSRGSTRSSRPAGPVASPGARRPAGSPASGRGSCRRR